MEAAVVPNTSNRGCATVATVTNTCKNFMTYKKATTGGPENLGYVWQLGVDFMSLCKFVFE